ncbi:MAG TPA: hypothetical protein PKM88_08355, partial [bacterium]|nr:hypothetical protein [bacterium]
MKIVRLHALPLLALAVLLVVIALPLLDPAAAPWPGDLGEFSRPLLDYDRHADHPWNPYLYAGRYGIYDGTLYPVWYPVYAAYHFFGSPAVFAWGSLAQLIWAGWGLYFLARRLTCGPFAAVYAALVFAGGAFFVFRLFAGQFPHVASASWTPWVFLACHRLLHDRRPLDGLWLGLAAAGQLLAGYPQFLYISACGCLICGLAFCADPAARSGAAWRQAALLLLLAGAVFLALTLPLLLPLQSVLTGSQRAGGLPLVHAAINSVTPEDLGRFWSPSAGRRLLAFAADGSYAAGWETAAYAGVTPWLVLGAGLALGAGRRLVPRLCLLLGGGALLLALGPATPAYPLAFRFLPLFDHLRVPGRWLLLLVLAFALLTAFAADHLRRRWPRPAGVWLLLPVLLTVELSWSAWPLLGRELPARQSSPYW